MSQTVNLNQLFSAAQADGTISTQTAVTVANHGARLQAGLGIRAADVAATEVVLLSMLLDDSSSIRMVKGNSDAVRAGVNGVLDAVGGARSRDDVLVLIDMLNRGLHQPYAPLARAAQLDARNYAPCGGTPLFEQAVVFLGTVLAKTLELESAGVPCRTVSLIVTDGADNSSRTTASDVAAIAEDMLKAESHIVFGYGVSDGSTDFHEVFREMGIPDACILTSAADPRSIRQAFQLVSRSVARASQNAQAFGQVAMGGLASHP